jgi:hypothetical protein
MLHIIITKTSFQHWKLYAPWFRKQGKDAETRGFRESEYQTGECLQNIETEQKYETSCFSNWKSNTSFSFHETATQGVQVHKFDANLVVRQHRKGELSAIEPPDRLAV